MGSRPIANKYHEGKMKRTLKRELKVPELAERKADGTSVACVRLLGVFVMGCKLSASALRLLNKARLMLLALCVIGGVMVRTTLGIW